MYSIVSSAAVCGIDSILVQTEADVCDGLPLFEMVGELSTEVREGKERIRAAIRNTGIRLAPKRITVNLYPADIRKGGTGFDLPIAIAILAAYGHLKSSSLEGILFAGEVTLNGRIHPIDGILPMVLAAKEAGKSSVCIPKENRKEAELVEGIRILPAETLGQVIEMLQDFQKMTEQKNLPKPDCIEEPLDMEYDFANIHGQKVLKRVCEIAAAGRHNLMMVGPPGAGKTMAAKAIPGILPRLSQTEALEVARIYSVSGLFEKREHSFFRPPFQNPHHTITLAGMAGGGRVAKPGEISMAHNGVLFLDEMTEFQKNVLEALRQPLEEKCIRLVRTGGTYCYPADIMLVSAMNPCSCGCYPDRNKCTCSEQVIRRHLDKISRPLWDRMDLAVEVQRIGISELKENGSEESSEEIRRRVEQAVKRQKERFQNTNIRYNSRIPAGAIAQFCPMEPEAAQMLEEAYERLQLSARGYYKIIRAARTIADLEQEECISRAHMAESLLYRNMDRRVWEQI